MGWRDPVGDARIPDLVLSPDQALCHGGLRHEKRPPDLGGGQPGQGAERESDPGLQSQRRMTASEDQPQPVVWDIAVLAGGCQIARAVGMATRQQRSRLVQLGRLGGAAAQPVQGAVAGDGCQPRTRPLRYAIARPALHRLCKRILGTVLGDIPVTGHPDGARDGSAPATRPPGTPPPVPARLAGKDWTYVPTSRHAVALTFDAGANDDAVASILATLQRTHVPATFFLTGTFVTRFPYGDADARTIAIANQAGYVPVRWTVDTLGWEGTAGHITTSVVVSLGMAGGESGVALQKGIHSCL